MDDSTRRPPVSLYLAALAALPGSWLGVSSYLGLPAPHLEEPLLAVIYGGAIIGAAFLLSWAAEAVQVDINAGLALALLALLAVLPEYAVDFVFATHCGAAFTGDGSSPEVCSLALANMTGANRVLVGVGWPLVVLVATLAVWRTARREGRDTGDAASASSRVGEVRLAPAMSVEIGFLAFATLYSLSLPLRTSIGIWDSVVLIGLFVAYAWRLSRMPRTEPDLLGVSAWVGRRPRRVRRTALVVMFSFAALVILATAEHFAESLVASGRQIGISEFLLVQWVAPLASESPELIVACLYAWRLKASDSLGTLLSSKVNQWTLLVGGLPVVFAVSAMTTSGLPLDTHQRYELLITGAQSLFAVALLVNVSLNARAAIALLGLFLSQFLVSVLFSEQVNQIVIVVLSAVYVVAAVAILMRHRGRALRLVRDATVSSLEALPEEPQEDDSVRAR
ncbi:sodium:proton exchanger [Nocardioides sp. GXQ0305]|uniref:sodium:proton exchanger n=1 Tax=Nocardioides sp. GXQ0305 TaxID=3423912 RepID=UPI003D7E0710